MLVPSKIAGTMFCDCMYDTYLEKGGNMFCREKYTDEK